MTAQWILDLSDGQLAALLADPTTTQSLHAELTFEAIARDRDHACGRRPHPFTQEV